MRVATSILTALILGTSISNCNVHAQLDTPGWSSGQAERVDPGQLLPVSGGGDVDPLSGGAAEPADVAELARGLQYDPLRIFDYVHNRIEYTPYFGYLKGASQTLLERSGNDFDQAVLLFRLLSESGYTPVYAYGTMQIPMWDNNYYDLPNWLVTQESTSAVETILANGGIPYAFSVQNYAFMVDRIWVEVDIDGQTRKLDPAFKRHYGQAGESLTSMMNYSRSTLLAQSGGQTGSDYVQNVSESALFAYLDGLSTNLQHTLSTNHANAAIDEILGNIGIIAETVTNLPTALRFASTTVTNWTAIPAEYCHQVTLTHGGMSPIVKKTHELAGRRLSITYEGGGDLQLASTGPVSNLTQIAATIPAFEYPTESSNTIALAASPDISTNVPLAGSATPTNPVSVSTIEDFGVVYNNKSPGNIKEWTIDRQTNNSFTRIYLYEVTLVNNTSGAFSLTAGGGTTDLHPGQSFDIKARFNGLNKTRGTKTAQVQVSVYYAGEYQGGYNIELTGRVAEFPSVNFSGVSSVLAHLGTPVTETLTFHNDGNISLSITNAMTLSGGTPQRFALVSGYGTGTVNESGTRAIEWRFDAGQHGAFSTELNFDIVYDGLAYTVNGLQQVQGDARYIPSLSRSSDLDFGTRTFGSTALGYCAIQNTLAPSAPLSTISIIAVSITNDNASCFSISSGGQAGTLAAGVLRTIAVNYHTTQTGSHTAAVKVDYRYDGIDYSLEIPLSGETLSAPLATLWLDDDMLATEAGPVSSAASLTIAIDHPYAAYTNTYADATVTYPLKRGGIYAIIHAFGGSETGLPLERRQRQLQAYREAGLADNSRQVLTESLNVIGQGWMEQTAMATRLINRIAGVRRVLHHRFGLMAQEEGYYVDVKAQLSAGGSIAGIQADSTAAFKAGGLIQSAMEHGILEQMQGSDKPGASTIKLLALANAGGGKVYRVTSGNFTTVTNQLSGYSTSELAAFSDFVSDGGSLILPANGSLTLNEWTGKGYIGHGPQGNNSTVIQMIITGDYGTQNGGYNSYTGNLNVQNTYDRAILNIYEEAQRSDPASAEPVNLATGDYFFDHTDLALGSGEAPRALAINRHYDSANRNQDGPLGFGWTHSYNIHISEHTQYKAALGQRTPADAAAMLVAAVATLDLLKNEDNAKGWLTASLVNKWAMDAITENAVSVHIGSRVLTYVKQPDGSYTPPPGVTTDLTQEAGLYRLTERFGKQYRFNSAKRLASIVDADSNSMSFTYNSSTNLQSVADSYGRSLTFTYSGNHISQIVDSTGRTVSYAPRTIASTDAGTVTNTWNARGELLVARDALGNETTYTYDNLGLMTSVTDADGNTVSNIYNAAGLKTQTIDPRGNATTYTYTPSYEISTVNYPDGSTVSNTYDSADRLIATTDGEGNTTTFTYDSAGRRIAATDALGHSVYFALDPNGNTLATTNALGHVAYNAVDPLDRVTNTWDLVDSQMRANVAEFDAAGRQSAAVNPLGQRTGFLHDPLGRVTTMTRPDLATEHNAYDALGNLVAYTNAKNVAIVQTTYDGQSRPIAQTNALGNGKSWTYDAAGNLISRRDAEGAETTYAYDRMNRIDTIEYPDNSVVGFNYDEAGNMVTATNADASLSFGYDPMNRISSVTSSVYSVYSVVQYSHDKNGNRTGLTLPGNKTIVYTYDDANRLSGIDLSAFSVSSAFSVVYDAAGNPTNITYPNGVTASYTYDEGGRLTGLTYTKSGSAFIDRAYTYNPLGQITKRTISAGLEAVPPDTHQYLRHNAADQLTHVSRMDNYENPERWRDVGPDYDANGATTNITVRYQGLTLDNAFTWDYEGRLVSYSGEHQTNLWFVAPPIPESLSFKYDALGGRIARSAGAGGDKIHVLDQAASLKNVLVERASNGTIERYYIYAPGFGLVAHIDANGTARYYHGDHLGSTIALTDANGNVTDQFNYTPYGELMARTGSTDTPYTFCGRHGVYWEGGSLYHMKARYYRADLARFISVDPLGIAGGVNLYAYANGDPIRFLDALGLCAESGEIRPSNWISSDSWWAGLINQFSNPVEYEMREFVDSRGGRANISDEDWLAAYSQAEQSERHRDIAMDSMSVVISHSLFGGATLVSPANSTALTRYEPWPKTPTSPHADGFFFGARQAETARAGQIFSRLGNTSGSYVAPSGTSLSARGLPAGYQGAESLWKVTKPFSMESGLSAPWQGSSGMGIQHKLPQSIDNLWNSGFLSPVQ